MMLISKSSEEKEGAESGCCWYLSQISAPPKHFADHVPMNLREANEAALCSSKMSRCLQYGGITRSLDKVSRITPVTVLQTVILRKHSIITGQMLQNKNVYYNSLILKCDNFNNSCSASLAIKFY